MSDWHVVALVLGVLWAVDYIVLRRFVYWQRRLIAEQRRLIAHLRLDAGEHTDE